MHDAVPDACWVIERSFLRAEVVEERRGRWEERGVDEGMCDEQGLRKAADTILNEVSETDEGESARGVRRRERENVPEERADVPPIVCEVIAVVWIWERCGDRGITDGREEREAQLVSCRKEHRIDVRDRSPIVEHRCVGSEMRDGANALYARNVRKRKTAGCQRFIPYRDICLRAGGKKADRRSVGG